MFKDDHKHEDKEVEIKQTLLEEKLALVGF